MLNVAPTKMLPISIEKRGNLPVVVLSPSPRSTVVIGPPRDVYLAPQPNEPSSGPGTPGASAYQVWLDAGNAGSVEDFFQSLKGADGASAYGVWLAAGNNGTWSDFITALRGQPGAPGASSYQIWLAAGHTGSEVDFLTWLRTTSAPNPPTVYPTPNAGWSAYEGIPLRLDRRGDTLWIRGVVILDGAEFNDTAAFALPPELQLADTIAFTGAALAFLLPVAAMVYIDAFSSNVYIKVQMIEDLEGAVGPVYFNIAILLES